VFTANTQPAPRGTEFALRHNILRVRPEMLFTSPARIELFASIQSQTTVEVIY